MQKEKKSSSPPVCHLTNVIFQVSHVTYHRSDNIIIKQLLELASYNCKTVVITPCVFMSNIMCHLSPIKCHMSHVICHRSHVTCHMSHVTCRMSQIICSCFLGGGEGGRANIAASSGWRVCHQLGKPCLLLIRTTIMVYCNSIDNVENLKSATYSRFSKISNFYIFEIRTFIIHAFAITPPWKPGIELQLDSTSMRVNPGHQFGQIQIFPYFRDLFDKL